MAELKDKEKSRALFKAVTFVFFGLIAGLVFAMGIVRGQCITKGYELSQLAAEVDKRKLKIEKVEADRAMIVSKERLFSLAEERGFVLMNEGKTFNVQ